MLDKLEAIKARFDQVGVALTNPEIINNQAEFGKLSKEYRSLEKIVQPFEEYKKVLNDYQFVKENLNSNDEEMKDLAKMELPELEMKKDSLEKILTQLLIPKDPQDDKNAILEIRAGTGGDEASLFAGDLLGMYLRYCAKKGWKTAIVSESEGTAGGYKEVVVEVTGEDVYGTLKFESGVHRVQRVPATETQGRVHTSAATVAVIPEAEEVDFELKESDVKNGNCQKWRCRRTKCKQSRNQGIFNPYTHRNSGGMPNRANTVRQSRKSYANAAYKIV